MSNVVIFIVNSSDRSIENVTSILEIKILSKQRPNIACLTHEDLKEEQDMKNFMQTFIVEKINEYRMALKSLCERNEFSQLEIWKNKATKRRSTSVKRTKTESESKKLCRKQKDQNLQIILDSPNEENFYLIFLDIYDYEIIKSIASFDLSLLIGLINLYPRSQTCSNEYEMNNENFWKQLLSIKYTKCFDNIAFFDLDVPIHSNYILKKRSQLIYDQFCHFFYDFEDLKYSYKNYCEHIVLHDVNIQKDNKDFEELQKRLDKIPTAILDVQDVHEAIMEQIAQDDAITKGHTFMAIDENSTRKFIEMKANGKTIYDLNDSYRCVYAANPQYYSYKINKLMESCSDIWDHVDMKKSIEQKQIENYFMGKIMERLECNRKDYDSIELYFYVLQFKNWHHAESCEKMFYENRSVGHKRRMTNDKRHLRKTSSDACIEYRNLSTIPFEIEQFINNKVDVVNEKDIFYTQFLSGLAMLHRINALRELHHGKFCRKYLKFFDVLLIKFPTLCDVPEVFTSKIYSKTLSTPLCFRDFNDYEKYELPMDKVEIEENSESNKNFSLDPRHHVKSTKNDFLNKSFSLPTSIKAQQKRLNDNDDENDICSEQNDSKREIDSIGQSKMVYNVCNRRTEFQIEESEFQSHQLSIKASIFTWLNSEKHLNFACTLHDEVQFSYSYDIRTNLFNNVTLTDVRTTGMICSIDVTDVSHDMMFSFPHGMLIKIINVDTVEMSWIETSHEMNINNGETKRTYFSNGFVMIEMLNGTFKVYSPNGTIFDISNQDNNKIKASRKSMRNEKLTNFHKFSLSSIHFLEKYINISAFVMILPAGNRFSVVNNWIVDEMEPLYYSHERCNELKGYSCLTRSDGLKILHKDSYTKCSFVDGTYITKTYYCNQDNITTIFDSCDMNCVKPSSILDDIWLSDIENHTKNLIDVVLEHVNDDYFININHSCQVEHKKYGTVFFSDDQKIELKLFNGVKVIRQRDDCSICVNGISFKINNSKIEFYDEKCRKCFNSNKISINIPNSTSNDEKCKNEILISASDVDHNLFVIKRNGRQVFYEKENREQCQVCEDEKQKYLMSKYGEHWIVLNQDMTGYEIFSREPQLSYSHINSERQTWMKTDDTLTLCCNNDMYEISIDDSAYLDCIMENGKIKKDENVTSITSSETVNESSTNLLKTKTSNINVDAGFNEKPHRSIVSQPSDIILTENDNAIVDDSSISSDVISERQTIQLYMNPLLNLPKSIGVSTYFIVNNNKLTDVIEALCDLRKHSCGKFIINVDRLMKTPIVTKTFQEHFEFIVRRSIEGYISEKLKLYQMSMARMIIEDLLQNAFERFDEGRSSEKIDIYPSQNEKRLHEFENDELAQIIQNKSFSFV